ncbi:MAG: cyclic nucleotide-binding domain-containing protein [Candidatus Gracilibacteria bacterium]|nr:cyclic nucleotide-binding domain-containing protein [Candidatus Gracilibacteria bacterium]
MSNILSKLYLFEGFEKSLLNEIEKSGKIILFKENQEIIKQGETPNFAYIILEGIVGVIKNEKLINNIFAGDIFGEISLVTNEKRIATIKAQSDVKVLMISKENLLNLIKSKKDGDKIKSTILNRIIQNIESKKY